MCYLFSLQWPDYDVIIQGKQQLDGLIENILSVITAENKKVVLIHFTKNAATRGYYWSYAKKLFDDKINTNSSACPNELKSQESCADGTKVESKDNEAEDMNKKTESGLCEERQNETDILDTETSEDIVTGNGYFHSLQVARDIVSTFLTSICITMSYNDIRYNI